MNEQRPSNQNLDPFQDRVGEWMQATFDAETVKNKTERNHRFLEESLELVQSLGCTQTEAHMLVDYVFGRPTGECEQETGGVMVTLAALGNASNIRINRAAEIELARCWTKIDQIRAKQAGKPRHSPLPGPSQPPPACPYCEKCPHGCHRGRKDCLCMATVGQRCCFGESSTKSPARLASGHLMENCPGCDECTGPETLPIPDFLRDQENLRAERAAAEKPDRSLTLGGLVLQTARGDTKERTLSAEETAQMARARAATEKPACDVLADKLVEALCRPAGETPASDWRNQLGQFEQSPTGDDDQ